MEIRSKIQNFLQRLKQTPRLKLFLIFLFSLTVLVLIIGGVCFVMNKDKILARRAIQKHFIEDFSGEDDAFVQPEFLGFSQQSREVINVYGVLKQVELQRKTLTLDLGGESYLIIPYQEKTEFYIKPAFLRGALKKENIDAYIQQTKRIEPQELIIESKLKLVYQKPDFTYPWKVFQLYDN